MGPTVGVRICRFLLAGSPSCLKRSISFLCAANIFFSFGFKEISPRAALRAASEMDLIMLSGLLPIIHEIISGCLLVARYLMVLLQFRIFLSWSHLASLL